MTAGEHRLALPAGYQLRQYRLQEVLGAGGFGITYLAEDGSLGRRVAVKELLPNDIATRLDGSTVVAKTKGEESNLAWARDRFMQEGRALAACEHPNVIHVYEMIEANGTAYMVTKFEAGRSLSAWLKEVNGTPTESEMRAILVPLLAGLEKVHAAGFLHRDLKPENIYLTDDGRPILLDFGSARQAISDRTTSLTSIVTAGYAPFEQYHEDGKQGAWTDLYALAAVLYRAIHGKKPPEATRRLKDDPCLRLAKEYAGKYSAPFLTAIDKALAVEAQKRPQSVAEWRPMFGDAPRAKEIVPGPWWEPWLEKAQPLVAWAKAQPLHAAGAAAGVVVLGLVAVKMVTPKPVVIVAAATPAPVPEPPTPSPQTPPPVVATTPKPATETPKPVVVVPPAPGTPKPALVWDAFRNATPAPVVPSEPMLGPPPGKKWTNSLGMTLAPVPGGNAHLDTRETRRADFEAFVQATGYNATAGTLSMGPKGWQAAGASWVSPGFPQTPQHPVVGVNAYDAVEFCRWLTEKERQEGRIDARLAYRLPTDVEWSSAVGSQPFPWGDAWPPTVGAGNYAGEETKGILARRITGYRDNFAGTAPTGTFQANAHGFYDMGGNALEWVGLWYRPELNAPEVRQQSPELNDAREGQRHLVLRGGSWAYFAEDMMRTATHDRGLPEVRDVTTGFRCVLAPVGPQPAFTLPPLARPTEAPAPAVDPETPVERRLVAIWETKIAQPKGSTTIRWQQNADGRYTVETNGTTTDAGTLTAADGRLRQTSDVTKLSMDVTYQFKSSTQLVTNGPLGTATWRRVRALATQPVEERAVASEEKKDPPPERRSEEPRPKNKPTVPSDVRREIQKRVPFRLPF